LGAIDAYEAALRASPDRLDVRSNLGAALAKLGRFEEAAAEYRKALEVDPWNAAIRFNLGLALYKTARIREAAEEFRKVLEREPDQKSAMLLLADCQLQMGDDAAVVALLSPHDATLGEDRLFAYLLGTALIRQGQTDRGQLLVDRLFRGGDSAEAHLLLGAQHLRRDDFHAAVPELKRAVELGPSLPTVHSMYGIALMNTGERTAAVEAFLEELKRNPYDFEANLRLGLLLRDEDKLDEAMDYLQRAATLRPQHPDVLYGLGRVYVGWNQMELAQKALEDLTRATPDFEPGHVLLAQVYYRLTNREAGDREREIVERLKEARRQRELEGLETAAPQGSETP